MAGEDLHLDDFTERGYAAVLTAALDRYRFEPFGTSADEPHVLWRHDVDVSPQRAVALAEIEREHGVRSTWFLYLHSTFYNLLEQELTRCARRLAELGHWIGLHFDAGYYESPDDLVEHMAAERALLERVVDAPVEAISFHNPDVTGAAALQDDAFAGMVNAYGHTLRERYPYVSDSNGYWRFRRLAEVLAGGDEPRLHVLTHPEWWQAEPMPPRARIQRAIDGRARSTADGYDQLLAAAGRRNARD